MGLFSRLFGHKEKRQKAEKYKIGMQKTRDFSLSRLKEVLENSNKIDDALYDELEEIFIMADMGVDLVVKLVEEIREYVDTQNIEDVKELESVIIDKMFDSYLKGEIVNNNIRYSDNGLTILLFVGVNGTGKTTTIAKIAHMLKNEKKKVMLAAGDTFRAGAVDQLKIWGDRVGVKVEEGKENQDPSSVIYDAIKKAKEEKVDVLLCDTAGRLQTKTNLMKELEKIKRVIDNSAPGSLTETLLVIDATTGQNGLSQAKLFNEVTNISGVVLTKVDGTAKGGIVLAIRNELNIPIKFIGLGEKLDDIEYFDIENYIYGLFADMFKE